MTTGNAFYSARDLAHVWHPCTQMKDHEELPMIPVRRGSGVWLEDFEGRRYLDAISSWWVNLFGHANPRINAAVREQLEKLEQVILAGFTHEPVIALSEALTSIVPAGLTRCFYADNGSSAVEVAVKMSFHYWRNVGKTAKRRFITLANSYHGETLGALAVGNVELYKDIYKPLLMDVITVPSPDCFGRERGESWAEHSRRKFAHMEAALAKHAHETAAVIVEPLVQCAGSMRMYDPVYLALLRQACDRYGVHLIADEIAVGFGRTGTLFACEQAGIRPDMMCLSKGLTAGYLPLSTVVTTDPIYAAFYDEYVKLTAFLHSHSFTGNPLACSAALASLDIFRTDDVLARNRNLSAHLGSRARELEAHPHVAEVRQHGMIVAVELVRDKATREPYPWQERRGLRIYRHALSRGVLLRPIGTVLYFMPPYVITPEEIDLMVEVAREGIELRDMRLTRVHVPGPLTCGSRRTIEGDAANHITRVLRLERGDPLTVFDGRGGEYAARIEELRKGAVIVAVADRSPVVRESPLSLTLAQGVSRGERMDWVVQKATELGVTRIVPVLTERSVVKLDAKQAQRKLLHWQGIATGACEQSGRDRLPAVAVPLSLAEFLRAVDSGATRVLLSPAARLRVADLPPPDGEVIVLIGPEGGLAQAEQQAAVAAGFAAVRLGPRVLRTETAAVAALTLIQHQFGDL